MSISYDERSFETKKEYVLNENKIKFDEEI